MAMSEIKGNAFRYYVINNHKLLPGLEHLHSDREKHLQEPVPGDW